MMRKTAQRQLIPYGAWILLGLLYSMPTLASDFGEQLVIHGLGSWAYAETDGNRYLLASPDGEAENLQFALNLQATPHEKLSIVAQVNFHSDLTMNGEEEVDLDFAFAEWAFSDRLKVRLGRIKHPFGIYGEVFDVGTIRPFYMLPQSIYGPVGATAKAYNGIGLTGFLAGDRWGLKYDLYGGEISTEVGAPGAFLAGSDDFFAPWLEAEAEVRDAVGIKLDLFPPLPGLTLGTSSYIGKQDTDLFGLTDQIDFRIYAIHAEYVRDALEIRNEWILIDQTTLLEATGYYFEASYRLSSHWQLAVRHDSLDAELADGSIPPGLEDLFFTRDTGFSINYWFTPGFVVRLEYHQVEGNRIAFPEDPAEILRFFQEGILDHSTDVVLFGVQFDF